VIRKQDQAATRSTWRQYVTVCHCYSEQVALFLFPYAVLHELLPPQSDVSDAYRDSHSRTCNRNTIYQEGVIFHNADILCITQTLHTHTTQLTRTNMQTINKWSSNSNSKSYKAKKKKKKK
jgi:hypothetical protein